MTALSDAITAATVLTGGGSHAGFKAAALSRMPGGTLDTQRATYLANLRAAGAAIKAAGGDRIQAGLLDTNGDPITANNGWIGRTSSTHGSEGVEGVVLAGVDYPTWDAELAARNF